MTSVPHRTSLSRGPEGKANRDRRELVRSAKCAGLRHGGGTRRCGIAAGVARALQRCSARACMALLLRPEEVRRVDNTCTQCDPKTSGSLAQYILYCRLKGKLYDQSVCPSNQGRACCLWVSRSRRPATALTAGTTAELWEAGRGWPRESKRHEHGGVSHGHWPCAPKTVPSPSWMHVYRCI
jgi:hypothetical protein